MVDEPWVSELLHLGSVRWLGGVVGVSADDVERQVVEGDVQDQVLGVGEEADRYGHVTWLRWVSVSITQASEGAVHLGNWVQEDSKGWLSHRQSRLPRSSERSMELVTGLPRIQHIDAAANPALHFANAWTPSPCTSQAKRITCANPHINSFFAAFPSTCTPGFA